MLGLNFIGSSCCQRLLAMFLFYACFYKLFSELAKIPTDLNPELELAMLDLKTDLPWEIYFEEISYF